MLIGGFFFFFSLFIFFLEAYRTHLLFISDQESVKWICSPLAFLLGLFSILLSCQIKTEYEVLHQLNHQFKQKLKNRYLHKRLQLPFTRFFFFCDRSFSLKTAYKQSLFSLERLRIEAVAGMQRTAANRALSEIDKEREYNFALFEFEERAEALLSIHHSNPPLALHFKAML